MARKLKWKKRGGLQPQSLSNITEAGQPSDVKDLVVPQKACWLSLDPVNVKIDCYPRAISAQLEKSFSERDPKEPSTCVLGSDFFNATVHFHPSGMCYQTTPGMSMGRSGFKQPGYRSVKRYVKPAHDKDNTVHVYCKQASLGQWRLTTDEQGSDTHLSRSIPRKDWIDAKASTEDVFFFQPWGGEDLASGAWDMSVVVWQWCRGVVEFQQNVLALSDEWWCP